MKLLALAAACLLAATTLTGCGGGDSSTSSSSTQAGPTAAAPVGKLQIAVIPKGNSDEYWKSIHAGAMKALSDSDAASKYGIIWRGPVDEGQSPQQISIVEDMLNSGVAGIVLAPTDENALARVVDTAAAKNIPVVIVDSGVATENFKSYVATDNEKGGEMGGEYLAQAIGNKGRVILMRFSEGSASTNLREQGFLNAMKKHPDIQLVSTTQYGGTTADSNQKNAENLIAAYKKEGGGLTVDGIFTPNETSSFGMLQALRGVDAAGKVKFVGFDASEKLLEGLTKGEVTGLVVQDPINMGYLGVKTMINILENKSVDKKVDTGVHLATKENMDTPEIHDLLHPPLDKYLK